MGDPAGIGPEIIMRSLDAERLRQAGAMMRPGCLGVVLDEGSAAMGH